MGKNKERYLWAMNSFHISLHYFKETLDLYEALTSLNSQWIQVKSYHFDLLQGGFNDIFWVLVMQYKIIQLRIQMAKLKITVMYWLSHMHILLYFTPVSVGRSRLMKPV